ncbi:hypothetical protein KCU95_g17976, partial [Aureobasidium melanogenum]
MSNLKTDRLVTAPPISLQTQSTNNNHTNTTTLNTTLTIKPNNPDHTTARKTLSMLKILLPQRFSLPATKSSKAYHCTPISSLLCFFPKRAVAAMLECKAKARLRIKREGLSIRLYLVVWGPRAGRHAKGQRLQRQLRHQSLAQPQGHHSTTTVTTPTSTFPTPLPTPSTLKRKASEFSGLSLAGNLPNTESDADASSLSVKRVRKSGMTDEEQGLIGGASNEQLRKSTTAQSVQDLNEDSKKGFDNRQESNEHAAGDSIRDSVNRTAAAIKPNHTRKVANKLAEKAKQAQQQQAHHNSLIPSLTTTSSSSLVSSPSTSSSPQLYTISLQNKHHGIPASSLRKKGWHQTCFLWYHGICPKKKGKYCEYLHALTEPPSYVQPLRGYVHDDKQSKESEQSKANMHGNQGRQNEKEVRGGGQG